MRYAIVTVDRDGRIEHWNDVAEELFGYAADEVIGESVELLVPEEHRDAHRDGLARVAAGGERHLVGAAINLPVRVRSGEVLAFPARFNHLDDPHGELVGATAIFGERTGTEEAWSPIAPADEDEASPTNGSTDER